MMLMGKGGLCGFETPGLHEGVHRLEEACEPSEAVYFDTSLSGVRKLAERLFLKTQLVFLFDWAGQCLVCGLRGNGQEATSTCGQWSPQC